MPYPAIAPRVEGMLDTDSVHRLHFVESGAPDGLPVLCVHGGPGSGLSPRQRRYFDPARFRIVQLDQRGCGQSQPLGELAANDTDALVADMERLRAHLGIDRWLLFGGSWGATLSLVYASRHARHCSGLILRGSYLASTADHRWFLEGAGDLLPDAWARFTDPVAECQADRLLRAYHERLFGDDATRAAEAARAWLQWEAALDNPVAGVPPMSVSSVAPGTAAAEPALLARCRILVDYMTRQCDLPGDSLLAGLDAIVEAGVPVALVHGRLDLVCRARNAWQLHHRLPGSHLAWVEAGGHNPFTDTMTGVLGRAVAAFAEHGDFRGWRDGRRLTAQADEIAR